MTMSKIKKRILGTLIIMFLVLTYMPSEAHAYTPPDPDPYSYPDTLYVGDTLVYNSDDDTDWEVETPYYWKESESGDNSYTQTESADDYLFSVSIDGKREYLTLTLNGIEISSFSHPNSYDYGIYSNKALHIVLENGTTNIINVPNRTSPEESSGIYVSGALTIEGKGSLSVSGGTYGIMAWGWGAALKIEGGKINSSGNAYGIIVDGNVRINGGTVNATGLNDSSDGIAATGNLTMYGGSITASGNRNAVGVNGSTDVSIDNYKYRTNTITTNPETDYTMSQDIAFTNSTDFKYVEILSCPRVCVSGDNIGLSANSSSVVVSGVADSGNTSYWLNGDDGKITSTSASAINYNVKYNEATRTLTLKDANITSYYSNNKIGIYAYKTDLNIVLEGHSVIGNETDLNGLKEGIYVHGNLSISSDSGGTLTIIAPSYSSYNGIRFTNDLSINGAIVKINTEGRGIDAEAGGFSLIDGEVSIVSGKDGIKMSGDIVVTGGNTKLNVTAGENSEFGIISYGNILIDDAELNVNKFGRFGDAVFAGDNIRISGAAKIKVVDWSIYDICCGLHSDYGSVVIGETAYVDICSQSTGVYAGDDVLIGYVWNGSDYVPSGSPTVKVNEASSIEAITPESDDDFTAGTKGIHANGSISIFNGQVTSIGNTSAISLGEDTSLSLPSSYKYKSNTQVSEPDTDYKFEDYVYSTEHKYLQILTTYAITKADVENGSFTVSVDSADTEIASAGDIVTLSAFPDSDYKFSSWNVYKTGDNSTRTNVRDNSFTMPVYPVTVKISFAKIISSSSNKPSRTITVTETSSGLFSDSGRKIMAEANMISAFSSSVEVKVTDTNESSDSFMLGIGDTAYPFDISLYIKGTNTKTKPNDGYAVTIYLPVPDNLIDVKNNISVAHKSNDNRVKMLDSELKQIDGAWYIVFKATEFSPYALVVRSTGNYLETAGVPYYIGSSGKEIFIGFAANEKYIAPSGAYVLFKENKKSYSDINSHWAINYIDFVTEREIFLGTDNCVFSPDLVMTRAMFTTVIGRLYERSFGEIKIYQEHVFKDCDYDGYYGRYTDWASENNIISGYGNGLFGPDDPVTRQQMAAIFYRFADFLGAEFENTNTELSYPDSAFISSWAVNAARYCQDNGLIKGRDNGNFVPDGNANRAEVSAIIERFINNTLK